MQGQRKFFSALVFSDIQMLSVGGGRNSKKNLLVSPKALCIVSRYPNFDLNRDMMTCIYQEIIHKYNLDLLFHITSEECGLDQVEEKLKQLSEKKLDDLLEFFITTFFYELPFDCSNGGTELY